MPPSETHCREHGRRLVQIDDSTAFGCPVPSCTFRRHGELR